jgi:RHS repeat-associated protein
VSYDATGNITSRSDVASGATWTYDPVRKHAVTQAGSSSFSYAYDANGNMSSRQGLTVSWASYNYPTSISAGSGSTAESVNFSYGPGRQRWQQLYSGNGTVETTDYIGGLMQLVTNGSTSDYRHYIYAGNEPVAVYSRKSTGVSTFSYLLSDHQGSVASITNSSGAQVVGESYTPFGTRRNPTTWSGAAANSDLTASAAITREGYTFQTGLGLWMGLNHMNGRVQDAITGRFISADPIGTSVNNTQSWNRYSYVANNPVTDIDPSGFDDDDPDPGFPGCEYVDICTVPVTSPPSDPGDSDPNDPNSNPGFTPPGGAPPRGPATPRYGIPAFPSRLAPSNTPAAPQQIPCMSGASCYVQPQGNQQEQPTQCINADGTIGNDPQGSLSNPNVGFFDFLDLEGYLGPGGGIHFGAFYDRSTGNYGLFRSVDSGGGWGGSAGTSFGAASQLSAFQGPTSVIGGGYGPISGSYQTQPESLTQPVSVSIGGGANMMPVVNLPASAHAGKSYTSILTSTLPLCH